MVATSELMSIHSHSLHVVLPDQAHVWTKTETAACLRASSVALVPPCRRYPPARCPASCAPMETVDLVPLADFDIRIPRYALFVIGVISIPPTLATDADADERRAPSPQ
jgi:hypothetical protein